MEKMNKLATEILLQVSERGYVMENIRNILVVSRMIPYSRKAIEFGISLARKFDAQLYVLHLNTKTVDMLAVNAPGLFPGEEFRNFRDSQQEAQEQLDKIIRKEINSGYPVKELVSDREPVKEIERVVREEKIDLLLMSAHEEGRIEHALFGGEDADIIRKMSCSILLVKNEPGPVEW